MSDAWFQVLPSHAAGDTRDAVVFAGSGHNTRSLQLSDVLEDGQTNRWNAANTDGVTGEALSATEARCQLRVEGTTGDQVTLNDLADWTLNPNDMVDGNTYSVWNHTSAQAQLLIDSRVIVA